MSFQDYGRQLVQDCSQAVPEITSLHQVKDIVTRVIGKAGDLQASLNVVGEGDFAAARKAKVCGKILGVFKDIEIELLVLDQHVSDAQERGGDNLSERLFQIYQTGDWFEWLRVNVAAIYAALKEADLVSKSAWLASVVQIGFTCSLVHTLLTTLLSSIAMSTLRSYLGIVQSFRQWYLQVLQSEPSFPTPAFLLSMFLLQKTQSLGSHSSVHVTWAALKWAHQFCGFDGPFNDHYLCTILRGLSRQKARPASRKRPITRSMLDKIVRLNAHSEATLSQVFVPSSKTDQLREGRHVLIAATRSTTCPLEVLGLYLRKAGPNGDWRPESYLFQTLRYDRFCKSYRLAGGKLTYGAARKMVDRGLQSIGMSDASFATHSLRAGGATAAAAAGVSERLLQLHGRWAQASSKDRYIEETLQHRLSVSARILP